MPIVRRRQFGPSDAGRELMAALLEQGGRLTPPGLRGLPATTVRYYVGDDTADVLGIPKADWTRVLFGPLADVSRRLSMEKLHRRAAPGPLRPGRFRDALARRQGGALRRPTRLPGADLAGGALEPAALQRPRRQLTLGQDGQLGV